MKLIILTTINSEILENFRMESDGTEYALYSYDRFNRLSTYRTGTITANYNYFASNLRADKTVNGKETSYIWNGQNLAYETGNGKENTYSYDVTGIHSAKINGKVNCYVKNTHGDVVSLTYSDGTKIWSYDFDAFGNQLKNGRADNNPFRYCGEYFDDETGLIYLRNRYYDTEIGRFITEDPAMDGLNWYAYCGNDPIIFVDPFGLSWSYFDSYLTESEQKLISQYTNNYNNANPDDLIYISGNIYMNEREYWHNEAMKIRDNLLDDRYLLYAKKDFITFGVTERNFKQYFNHDENFTFEQALYEYALSLYLGDVLSDGSNDNRRIRDKDGNLTKYAKLMYNFAGKISKLSGKEKANDVPSWARGKRPKQGQNGKQFAEELMNEKYGQGNWSKSSREYSQIKKWGDRGFN